MISASDKELKKAFYSHFTTYQNFSEQQIFPRRLSLFYAVECGLKVLLLRKVRVRNIQALQNHKQYSGKLSGTNGHDIQYFAKEVNYRPVSFKPIKCDTGDIAHVSHYNQVWRYNIKADEPTQVLIERELKELAEWIGGNI